MDTQSLYYFTELAKDLHMTKTANRLYISQQTLSNHIQRLESQLGAKLFYRKPALSLTYAGEFALAYANIVMKEQTNLSDILSDIEQSERGLLRFGSSTLRMNACLPAVMPSFTQKYPNVELRLTTSLSIQLETLVTSGDLDFAISTYAAETPELVQEQLMSDQIYLCVCDRLLEQFYTPLEIADLKLRSRNGAHLSDFSRLPFCIFTNRLGARIQACFEEAHFSPKVYLSTDYTQITTTIGFMGMAAFFGTQMNLASRRADIPADLNIFPLLYEDKAMDMPLVLMRHRQRYLSHYAKYFLDLLFDYFTKVEGEPILRLAPGGLR